MEGEEGKEGEGGGEGSKERGGACASFPKEGNQGKTFVISIITSEVPKKKVGGGGGGGLA
jgi:hypothetical protein